MTSAEFQNVTITESPTNFGSDILVATILPIVVSVVLLTLLIIGVVLMCVRRKMKRLNYKIIFFHLSNFSIVLGSQA